MINTCNHYEIEAHRTEHTGVWFGDNKLCAIGTYMCTACVLYVHNTIYTKCIIRSKECIYTKYWFGSFRNFKQCMPERYILAQSFHHFRIGLNKYFLLQMTQ